MSRLLRRTASNGAARCAFLACAIAACDRNASSPDAAVDAGPDAAEPRKRCLHYTEERMPFFGDLHVHTALSLDANLQGTRLRPRDSYRFAQGERVGLPPYNASGDAQRELQLERALDFAAVTDHAEFLGLVSTCVMQGYAGYDSPACEAYRDTPGLAFINLNSALAARPASYVGPCTRDNAYCDSAAMAAWNEVIEAAEDANDDSDGCSFTTFVGYEWSGSPSTWNLHRNVLFRNATVPALPFSYFDGSEEEQLWEALDRECLSRENGCDALTIPHNSNLSAGLMFEPVDRSDEPIDADYAKTRRAFEPLVEVFQHKGSSECLPSMGPDELCDYELLPYTSLSGVYLNLPDSEPVPSDYVRDALGSGLELESKLGVNPFEYGFIGSTDTHFGTAGAVSEVSFAGHGGAGSTARDAVPEGLADNARLNPGGLAVLWAEENSRDALFDAMRRREAYATSGTRIVLRFFGGFDYAESLCESNRFARAGYEGGVPMGGVLGRPESGEAPMFAVRAMKDPGTDAEPGVDLDRAQIIKGTLEDGEAKYQVFDITPQSSEQAGVDASCEPVGSGESELCAVFRDPDFDPSVPAFYYARVLENPSCRWHARVCRERGVDCERPETVTAGLEGCCLGLPELSRERAWSSPIFYRPEP